MNRCCSSAIHCFVLVCRLFGQVVELAPVTETPLTLKTQGARLQVLRGSDNRAYALFSGRGGSELVVIEASGKVVLQKRFEKRSDRLAVMRDGRVVIGRQGGDRHANLVWNPLDDRVLDVRCGRSLLDLVVLDDGLYGVGTREIWRYRDDLTCEDAKPIPWHASEVIAVVRRNGSTIGLIGAAPPSVMEIHADGGAEDRGWLTSPVIREEFPKLGPDQALFLWPAESEGRLFVAMTGKGPPLEEFTADLAYRRRLRLRHENALRIAVSGSNLFAIRADGKTIEVYRLPD